MKIILLFQRQYYLYAYIQTSYRYKTSILTIKSHKNLKILIKTQNYNYNI